METMRKPPRLQKRSHRFYCRASVPKALRPLVGKTEIIRALKTGDYTEALRRLPLASAQVDAELADARRRLRQEPVTQMDEHDTRQVVLGWLWQSERCADAEPPPEDVDAVLVEAYLDEGTLRDPNDPNVQAAVQRVADGLLADTNAAIDRTGKDYWRMCEMVRRAMLEHARRSKARLLGDFGATFDPAFAAVTAKAAEPDSPAAPDVTLEDLCRAYMDAPDRQHVGAKSRADYEVIFRALRELLGPDKAARSIRRADCREIRDVLAELPPNATKRFRDMTLRQAADAAREQGIAPMQPSTANGYLSKLSALFRWAAREDYVEKNPAEALRVSEPETARRDARRPFSKEQLRKIFGAPLYTGCKDDGSGYATPGSNVVRRGRFWVPLVGLFTGMRLNEVCQLEASDVRILDGVNCIVVTAEGDDDGKRLKTGAARRVVPVHPELERIGFLQHVETMRWAGETRLFPELRPGSDGYYSDPFSKWFARFLRKAGAKATRTSFHSLRHNFRDALREAGVPRDAVLALGGWAGNGGAEDDYGEGLRPSTLLRWVEKLRYELDLSHLRED